MQEPRYDEKRLLPMPAKKNPRDRKGCRLTSNRHPTYTQTYTVFFEENQWFRPNGDGSDGCDGLSFKKKQRRENREREKQGKRGDVFLEI